MKITRNGARFEVRDGDRLLASASTHARALERMTGLWRRSLTAAALPASGPAWWAVLAFTGVETDDGRMFDALTWRDLPLPLTAMRSSGHGQPDESFIVGRIDTITQDGSRVLGTGVYDTTPEALDMARLLDEGMVVGVSIEAGPDPTSDPQVVFECMSWIEDETWGTVCDRERSRVPLGLICAATQVATPAFGGAMMSLTDYPTTEGLPAVDAPERPAGADDEMDDDWFGVQTAEPLAASGDCGCTDAVTSEPTAPTVASLVAAGPLRPPAGWFADPRLGEPTPLTVTDDGRVFGHLATWDTCHVSIAGRCQPPPRSASGYAHFLRGTVRTAEGQDVRAGLLTLGQSGHAPDEYDAARATAHYANAMSAWAQVSAGEDRHGIWLAGALMSDVDDLTLRRVRATGPSGDWRAVNRHLELVGACQVVVQGFPVVRPVLAADGSVLALTASAGLIVGGDRLWALERTVDDLRAQLARVSTITRELAPQALTAARGRVG